MQQDSNPRPLGFEACALQLYCNCFHMMKSPNKNNLYSITRDMEARISRNKFYRIMDPGNN